jgi:hypothetical protein
MLPTNTPNLKRRFPFPILKALFNAKLSEVWEADGLCWSRSGKLTALFIWILFVGKIQKLLIVGYLKK